MIPPPNPELSSWKAIAAFLEVSVKTAQLWERDRGLPVHRIPGGRSRVWAEKAELTAWKRQQPGETAPAPGRRRWAAGGALAVVLSVLILGWILRRPTAVPHGVVPDLHGLTAFDREGNRLWRYATAIQRDVGWLAAIDRRNLAVLEDLDGDGRPEVLYAPQMADEPNLRALRCLDSGGREQWRFAPDRTVRTAAGAFEPPYKVSGLVVLPPGRSGHRRILVTSVHHQLFPSQVALLDHRGRVLREYWHTGHLHGGVLHHLNGRPVAILPGTNNTTRQAELVALDPETMAGASQEPKPEYQLDGLGPGTEVARLLFPRSCLNRSLSSMTSVLSVTPEPDGLTVSVTEVHGDLGLGSVDHRLTNSLESRSAAPSSMFVAYHERYRRKGELDHDLTDEELDRLRPVRLRNAR